MSYRNTLVAWFLAIALILGTVGGMVYNTVRGFIEDASQVTAAHEVLETLTAAMALLADAESGQRGYVITGRAEYLEPYHAAQVRFGDVLARLAALTADQPSQHDRAAQLAIEIRARLDRMHRTVTARAESFEAAQTLIRSDEGRRMTDRIRELVDLMTDDQRVLLATRDAEARQSATLTLAAGAGGLALATAIMLLLLQAIRRENLRREAIGRRLQDSNVELALSLERVRRLGSELSTMSAMSELLHSCRSIDEARPVIARSLQQLLPDTAGSISLLNSSQNLMDGVISWPTDGRTLATEATFVPDQCWALRRGRPHVIADTREGQLCGHLQVPPPAYACLPMMAQGETIGAMFVQGAAIDEERLRLVRNASEQIALALANLKLQESLRIQSIRDPLTGLFNRRYLEASLEREIARARRGRHHVCVIMLDVDHFKRFNDTFGHEAGDSVLVEFAGVLKACSRDDDIASRYGGEEFTLILPDSSIEVARERAELVRGEVRKLRIEHRRRPLGTITVSLGVAAYPEDGATAAAVIQAADAALYHAKQSGRDRVALATEVVRPS